MAKRKRRYQTIEELERDIPRLRAFRATEAQKKAFRDEATAAIREGMKDAAEEARRWDTEPPRFDIEKGEYFVDVIEDW